MPPADRDDSNRKGSRSTRRDDDAPAAGPFGPLPSGRHRFSRQQVSHSQRERLIAAIAAEVGEQGYDATTVGEIAATAHVSRRVFYQHFESKEECFAAAFDAVFAHLRVLMAATAAAHSDDWPRQVAAALRAVVEFFAAEPGLARFCLVESTSAGPLLQRRFAEVADTVGRALAARRKPGSDQAEPPSPPETALVGAVGSRLSQQVALYGAGSLPQLLPSLVEFVLTPYVGVEMASRCAAEVSE